MCWLVDIFLKKRNLVVSPSHTGYFVIKLAGNQILRTSNMTINTLLDDQEVVLTFQDIAGNNATAGTTVTWISSAQNIGSVTPSEDTLTAKVVTTGTLGTFTVTATSSTGATAVTTFNVGFDASQPVIAVGTPTSRIPAPVAAPVADAAPVAPVVAPVADAAPVAPVVADAAPVVEAPVATA